MQGKASSATVFDLGLELPQQHVNFEVDQARQREYWRWLLVGLVLVAAMLFNVWQRNQTFAHGKQLEDLNRERAEQELLGRHLLIEVYSLSSPDIIDRLAVNRLHLVTPGREDAVVLPLVMTAPQPPSSVVASR
jgi:cell division protein FtsL